MDMEETRDIPGPAEQMPPSSTWWSSDFIEKFGSVSLVSNRETLITREPDNYTEHDSLSSQTASQILWSTGMLSEQIPNGFYSVIPEKRLKEHFEDIPTLDELYALGVEGFRADIILVDTEKDKKLSMLKQLIAALVKGLSSNPAAMIKKIAGLFVSGSVESSSSSSVVLSSLLLLCQWFCRVFFFRWDTITDKLHALFSS
ncbi:hypothetical protein RHMOL_Rhmol06G0183800 [Rhododendron molle]|uniref:Uncharacterized protein n=1 Tax=Rhododendron molle TaxID=49168 RepID=A0ACC0NFQ8_RHOML|nr:hypothetical protein RHMOL_Rhmol06G0183800 [Rhododendron molle]